MPKPRFLSSHFPKLVVAVLFCCGVLAGCAQEFMLRDQSLARTSQGRQELKYLVGCALPERVSVKASVDGQHFVFDGSMGLAPTWATAPLTLPDQQLVSACMLARTNFFGKKVEISMSSDSHNAPEFLKRTNDERRTFPFFEAGFFGNLFIEEPEEYVCIGDNTFDRLEVLESLWRVCSLPAQDSQGLADESRCHFKITGLCSAQNFTQNGKDYSSHILNVYLRHSK